MVDPRLIGTAQLLSGVVALLFLKPALDGWELPGSRGFVVLVSGILTWAVGLFVGNVTGALGPSVGAYKLVLLGAELTAVGWLLTAVGVVRDGELPRRLVAAVAVGLLALQTLVWTNPHHGLVFAGGSLHEGTVFVPTVRIGFWIHAAGSYLAVAVGTGLLAVGAFGSAGLRRRQLGLLTLAALPFALANLLTVFELLFAPYDLSLFGYLGSAAVTALVLFEGRFLDVAPVARRTAMDEVDDAMVTVDAENRVLDANATARALFDVGDDYVGIDADAFFAPVPASTRARFADVDDLDTEVTVTTPDGERRTFLLSITAIGVEAERGRVFVFRDITERKRRERRLERQNERLERFAGIVSHDLRNPLSAATGRFELLCEIEDVGDSEHARAVDASLDRMESMIDDLLTMARAERTVEDPDRLALATVATDAWAQSDTGDAELVVAGDATVRADRDRLLHLFENLFRNAADHNTPPVTVRVGPLDGPDDGRSGSAPTAASDGFYVEDDGSGIPETERDEVFEHGYTTEPDGTGFGLSIVRSVADAHGWEVRVTDGSDGGARFELRGVELERAEE